MKKLFLIVILMTTLYTLGRAQGTDANALAYKNTPLSPTAASLYRNISWPVSYSTGMVNISIPLYEIKTGDLVLPISISYRSSGNKISQPAGIVGMNWSLNAEPVISRQVKQAPDEGGPGLNGYLNNNNLTRPLIPANYDYAYDMANGYADEEPDDFSYQTLQSSGQFYYRRNDLSNASAGSTIFSKPLAPVKISKTTNMYQVIESNGNIYEYPDSTAEITGTPSITYKSTWKVSRIKSAASSREITFKYQPSTFNYAFSYTNNYSIEDYGSTWENDWCNTSQGEYCGETYGDHQRPRPVIRKNIDGQSDIQFINRETTRLFSLCEGHTSDSRFSQTLMYLRNIQQIDFPDGKVVFEYWRRPDQGIIPGAAYPLNNSYMLGNITVFDKAASGTFSQLRKINFFQSSTAWNRETLDSIQILDGNNTVVEAYKFGYDPDPMPVYPYPLSDHWGYRNALGNPYAGLYTGVIATPVTITVNPCLFYPFDENDDRTTAEVWIGDNEKNAWEDLAEAKILKEITYPTGGFTRLEYERNQWNDGFGNINTGGGLRIKSISDYDAPGATPVIRTFKYGKNEDGNGYGWNMNVNDYILHKHITYHVGMGVDVRESDKRTYLPNSIYDYFFAEGTPVVYDCVHEYIGTPTSNIGKNVYEYDYTSEYMNQTRPRVSFISPLVSDLRNSYLYGKMLGKRIYKYENNAFSLVQKSNYKYETYANNINNRAQVRQAYCTADVMPVGSPAVFNPFLSSYYAFDFNVYEIFSAVRRIVSETDTLYANGGYLATSTRYEYDTSNMFMARRIVTKTSKGDSLIRYQIYPQDKSSISVYNDMVLRNIISPVIEETTKKNGLSELSLRKNNYAHSFAHILPANIESSLAGSSPETDVSFTRYDDKGNLLEYKDRSGIVTSIVWGYNHRYPIANIQGSDYATVEALVNVAALQSLTGQSLRTALNPLYGLPGSMVTVYTHEPLKGLTSRTDPSGKTISYEYDPLGRLKLIRDQDGRILKQMDYQYKSIVD